jgi:hypothetical protein
MTNASQIGPTGPQPAGLGIQRWPCCATLGGEKAILTVSCWFVGGGWNSRDGGCLTEIFSTPAEDRTQFLPIPRYDMLLLRSSKTSRSPTKLKGCGRRGGE